MKNIRVSRHYKLFAIIQSPLILPMHVVPTAIPFSQGLLKLIWRWPVGSVESFSTPSGSDEPVSTRVFFYKSWWFKSNLVPDFVQKVLISRFPYSCNDLGLGISNTGADRRKWSLYSVILIRTDLFDKVKERGWKEREREHARIAGYKRVRVDWRRPCLKFGWGLV